MTCERTEALELYRIYVDMVGRNEAKRLQANATYMGFAGGLVTISATIKDVDLAVLAAVGVFLSLIWFFTVKHHRNLATAKFKVVASLEEKFHFQPFKEEWNKYKSDRWPVSLTKVELVSPVFFGLVCFGYLICRIWPNG